MDEMKDIEEAKASRAEVDQQDMRRIRTTGMVLAKGKDFFARKSAGFALRM
jgi:hypothetical protein